MDYALAAIRRPGQTLYTLVDRGFAGLDYLGPSELYPWMRRVTRLKATMILHWDSVSAPLQEWPLYEGEVVEIPQCLLGRKKQVLCGAVLAHVGATCYLACHPDDVGDVLSFYQKRVWIEEQNRDIKTGFKGRVMRFLRAIRFERRFPRREIDQHFLPPVKLTSTGRPAEDFATMGSFDSAGREQLPEGWGCGRVCQSALRSFSAQSRLRHWFPRICETVV
jgi:hypothetical protein